MIAAAGAETCDEGKEIIPILEHLLIKGGNPNLAVPEEHGKSPLSAAERAGNLLTAEFLRKHGARE
jgi:ankyrin repeat protein